MSLVQGCPVPFPISKKDQAPGAAPEGNVTNGMGMQMLFPGASLEHLLSYISYTHLGEWVTVSHGHLVNLPLSALEPVSGSTLHRGSESTLCFACC